MNILEVKLKFKLSAWVKYLYQISWMQKVRSSRTTRKICKKISLRKRRKQIQKVLALMDRYNRSRFNNSSDLFEIQEQKNERSEDSSNYNFQIFDFENTNLKDNIYIITSMDLSRKVIAYKDLQPNETIFLIGNADIISIKSIQKYNKFLKSICDKINLNHRKDLMVLSLFLFLQSNQKKITEHSCYIKSLPTNLRTHSVYFSKRCLRILKGTMILENIKKFKLMLHTALESIRKCFQQLQKPLTAKDLKTMAKYLIICSTRMFQIRLTQNSMETGVLVPIADMINHSRQQNATWLYNSYFKCFEVRATRKILKGQQITISYGSLQMSKLVACYGFCEPLDEVDFVKIKLKLGKNVCIEMHDIYNVQVLKLRLVGCKGSINWEILKILRYVALSHRKQQKYKQAISEFIQFKYLFENNIQDVKIPLVDVLIQIDAISRFLAILKAELRMRSFKINPVQIRNIKTELQRKNVQTCIRGLQIEQTIISRYIKILGQYQKVLKQNEKTWLKDDELFKAEIQIKQIQVDQQCMILKQ